MMWKKISINLKNLSIYLNWIVLIVNIIHISNTVFSSENIWNNYETVIYCVNEGVIKSEYYDKGILRESLILMKTIRNN